MMPDANDTAPKPLEYAAGARRRRHRPHALGLALLPVAYVAVYVVLRIGGVFYPFYNQGGWDIDGTTHVRALDVAFSPAALLEGAVQNKLRWLQEPTGG